MATRQWQAALTGLALSTAGACSDPTTLTRQRGPDAALSREEGRVGIAAFTPVDLGTAGGLPNSIAEGINLAGLVAGVSYGVDPALDGTVTAWNAAGAHNIGVPAGSFAAEGKAINDFGDIVGIAYGAAGRRGFVWTPAGGFSILAGPPGATDVQAWDIEDNALTVVGEVTVGGVVHAFRWQPGSGYQDLHPAGYISSHANAIAPNGMIAGWAKTATGDHAVMWSPAAAFFDLGTLPGGTTSQGYDINSAGAVVGQSEKAGASVVAVMRRLPAAMQEASPFANSAGSGISDLGRMVGWAPSGVQRRAATKKGNNAFVFLPVLAAVAIASDAREVNRCGHAVGSTTFFNGVVHATRWTNAPCD